MGIVLPKAAGMQEISFLCGERNVCLLHCCCSFVCVQELRTLGSLGMCIRDISLTL